MLFNSFHFLVFFPLVVMLYFALPHRFRWTLLLAASYYFYGSWKVEYLFLIITSTLIDYVAGIQIGRSETRERKRFFLVLSLAVNLGLLFAFKYFGFFSRSLSELLGFFHMEYRPPILNVLLPVGISFYTFQTLSYTIDVYLGRREPEKHLGIFAVYVSFFPQLVAGPIERSTRLLPQFFEEKGWDWERARSGLRLMIWGFFKKVVVADRLSLYVDPVYSQPLDFNGLALYLATFFFAFQVYCDFSGYSDIAIGAARVMGYELTTNFRQPLFARSISELWERWHVTLTTWFRDYVYIPLGGSRVRTALQYRNLFLTFLVSGLWHGANWTFIGWGALNGVFLVIARLTSGMRRRIIDAFGLNRYDAALNPLRTLYIFHLFLAGLVFFRSPSVTEAFRIFPRITVDLFRISSLGPLPEPYHIGRDVLFLLGMIVVMNLYDWYINREWKFLEGPVARTAVSAFLFWAIIVYGVFNNQEFVYFQF